MDVSKTEKDYHESVVSGSTIRTVVHSRIPLVYESRKYDPVTMRWLETPTPESHLKVLGISSVKEKFMKWELENLLEQWRIPYKIHPYGIKGYETPAVYIKLQRIATTTQTLNSLVQSGLLQSWTTEGEYFVLIPAYETQTRSISKEEAHIKAIEAVISGQLKLPSPEDYPEGYRGNLMYATALENAVLQFVRQYIPDIQPHQVNPQYVKRWGYEEKRVPPKKATG